MTDKIVISPFFSRSVDDYFVRELESGVIGSAPRSSLVSVDSYKSIASAEAGFRRCDAEFSCLAKTGRNLGFRWVVAGYVDASAQGDYLLQIELLNAETFRIERKKEIVIEKDTQSLVVAAEMLTRKLFDPLPLSAPPPLLPLPPPASQPVGDDEGGGDAGSALQPGGVEYPSWLPDLESPKTWMWGSFGIAVVSGAGAVVMGVLSSSKESERERYLVELEERGRIARDPDLRFVSEDYKRTYGPTLDRMEEKSQTYATIANYAYVGTGLSLASAGLFFYLEYGRSKEPAARAVSLFSHPAMGTVGIEFGF